jgi:ADP-heptose:LPS heptosyltransferase
MRVVALIPGGVSEQILFFPTLDGIKRNYPEASIDVVVEPRSKGAYRVCKSVNEVLAFDFQDRSSLADWANLVGNLRDREYEAVITLEQRWVIRLLLWLCGIPTRVGFINNGNGTGFLTNTVPMKTEQYVAKTYHDLLSALEIKSEFSELTVNLPKSDIDWAQETQKRLGVSAGYILIDVEGGYPAQSWKSVIQDILQKQSGMPVILIKGEGSNDLIRDLIQSIPEIKTTSPEDIGKLAAMIAGANLMLCATGLAMHLSVGVQTYTLALFGAEEPAKLLPQSDKFIAIKSPSEKISAILPETVLAKIWGG